VGPPSGARGRVRTSRLADRYRGFVFDLDGVIFRGGDTIAAAPRVVDELRARGVPHLFATNNSSRTPEDISSALREMGVEAAPSAVLTSAQATADFLALVAPADATAYVIGRRGLREALADSGIRVVDGDPDRTDLVVVGWDREVDYARLRRASLLVQRGARLIASNADAAYPAPDGLWPGAGAILAAVVTTTGATPEVVGKPASPMFESARRRLGVDAPLVIGDRLDTDVAGAEAVGWDSLLVLSGVSTRADLLRCPVPPVHLAGDVGGLLEDRPEGRFRAAGQGDVEGIVALLQAAGLRADHPADRLDTTAVFAGPVGEGPPSGTDRVLATAAVERIATGTGTLRSVAVDPAARGAGLGALAVAHAVRAAPDVAELFLFTEDASGFFADLGFRPIERAGLPDEVATGEQAITCADATVMRWSR
jgi:glycerol 3-phosphatase-2